MSRWSGKSPGGFARRATGDGVYEEGADEATPRGVAPVMRPVSGSPGARQPAAAERSPAAER
ncbi:hypothetical protein J7E87_02405 [Streptomyces sp. ISL-1]|nr:hypothetical protein [Streptomyces sp. ISL-1]MBT2388288.1 hypothetical protein [Streptomyces sp. ISL-1]